MEEQLLNQIVPILITTIVGIIATVIKIVGDAVIELIKTKKEETTQKIIQGNHEAQVKTALEVWNIVEEHFRINEVIGDTIQLKITMFNNLLLKKVPGLTQEQLDYLRQTIAGEFNKGKQALAEDKAKQQAQINTQLQAENEQLKSKLATIQNTVA
ncbi:hypothetical protein SAMN02745163_03602 [Clostridium cavendishii DSM 21758]|uniref:Uncharacterized protein n=1 Tax=Clostridium cavendishii DSM 21758 TaxID=1121302 RepID=A0A1M6RJQ4_9CLOT|nr:hypothetical protein [Clostridium cavendishii]SHK32588.1 hypothetical protein SAMN02745163_03602 [Clostridium cavendishii DSM 21758]